MSTCLIKKLKAVVNNPDLPVIETMQQFTLDAIAASNNASMTDEQKYALNHFFYQIGAIQNNGIYAKMAYIGLPMIAGNVAGALNNYKGNLAYTVSDDRVTFTNHHLVATVGGNVSLGYNSLPKTLTVQSSMSVIVGIIDSETIIGPFKTKDSNDKVTSFSFNPSTFDISNIPYTLQSIAMYYNQLSLNKSAIITSGKGNNKGYYYDGSTQTVGMKLISTNEYLTSGAVSQFELIAPNPSFNNGVYYILAGEALTEAEVTLLLKELVALRNTFVV